MCCSYFLYFVFIYEHLNDSSECCLFRKKCIFLQISPWSHTLFSEVYVDLGLRQPLLQGEEYLAVVDEFMEAVHARCPKEVVQVCVL